MRLSLNLLGSAVIAIFLVSIAASAALGSEVLGVKLVTAEEKQAAFGNPAAIPQDPGPIIEPEVQQAITQIIIDAGGVGLNQAFTLTRTYGSTWIKVHAIWTGMLRNTPIGEWTIPSLGAAYGYDLSMETSYGCSLLADYIPASSQAMNATVGSRADLIGARAHAAYCTEDNMLPATSVFPLVSGKMSRTQFWEMVETDVVQEAVYQTNEFKKEWMLANIPGKIEADKTAKHPVGYADFVARPYDRAGYEASLKELYDWFHMDEAKVKSSCGVYLPFVAAYGCYYVDWQYRTRFLKQIPDSVWMGESTNWRLNEELWKKYALETYDTDPVGLAGEVWIFPVYSFPATGGSCPVTPPGYSCDQGTFTSMPNGHCFCVPATDQFGPLKQAGAITHTGMDGQPNIRDFSWVLISCAPGEWTNPPVVTSEYRGPECAGPTGEKSVAYFTNTIKPYIDKLPLIDKVVFLQWYEQKVMVTPEYKGRSFSEFTAIFDSFLAGGSARTWVDRSGVMIPSTGNAGTTLGYLSFKGWIGLQSADGLCPWLYMKRDANRLLDSSIDRRVGDGTYSCPREAWYIFLAMERAYYGPDVFNPDAYTPEMRPFGPGSVEREGNKFMGSLLLVLLPYPLADLPIGIGGVLMMHMNDYWLYALAFAIIMIALDLLVIRRRRSKPKL